MSPWLSRIERLSANREVGSSSLPGIEAPQYPVTGCGAFVWNADFDLPAAMTTASEMVARNPTVQLAVERRAR